MTNKEQVIKVKTLINAPVSEVYMAFTNATALCEWLCNIAQADDRPGGRLYFWWNSGYYASGEFIDLEPNEQVVFSWHGRKEPGISRVKVIFQPKENGTKVTLLHSGFSNDKVWQTAIAESRRGWQRGLENLKSVLETGLDIRFIRIPLLGVSDLDMITAEIARETDLPVKHGLRIGGVVDGSGAQASGLRQGDILTKMAGRRLTSIADLIEVKKTHRAGDQLKIIYFRDGEKKRGKLELSSRPLPEVPSTAEALATTVEKQYSEADQQLAVSLKAVDEDLANYRTAPQEWSVKEILSHLIANERETHSWIAGLIEGQEADFIYHTNHPLRVKAIVEAIPRIEDLLAELKCNEAETIALIHGLPPEFVARKRSYWRLGYNLLQNPLHVQGHLAQIESVLKAAVAQRTADAATVKKTARRGKKTKTVEVSTKNELGELPGEEENLSAGRQS
jgi:uncharacterized protein YndB with AHSA1/START domain